MSESVTTGWRDAFHGWGVVLAEFAWRWSFGIASWVLIVLTGREYLASVRFTNADWTLLQTGQPVLVAQAIAHALQGSGARLVQAAIIVALGLVVFWVLAASVGRAATLNTLLTGPRKLGFGSLVGLNFLRAAITLAAIIGYLGALVLAGFVAPVDPTDTDALLMSVLLFLALAIMVGFFWSVVNWFLSVAPIFVLQDGRDSWGAIADSVAFFRRRSGALVGVTLLFSGLKVMLVIFATVFAAAAFNPVHDVASLRPALWLALGITLLYFIAADVLYVARLAIYVHLAEKEVAPVSPEMVAGG